MRTQVAIVGAGPAGLLLSHLLHLRGIESVVLEARSREYVEHRVRAGVLEQGTVDTLVSSGAGERLLREGLVHHGIELRFGGQGHRIAFEKLVPGRAITVYGQQEVVKDLIDARLAAGGQILFEVGDVTPEGIEAPHPEVSFTDGGERRSVQADFIAGCDGFHGICRDAIPPGVLTFFDKEYPFGWLGVLAAVAPSSEELIYASNERGFALHSMRSPEVSRFYLQVAPDENIAAWPDDRIWAELAARLETVPGWSLATGPVLEKGITAMRSFVAEPMQFGRLFLAGDAAHIVPPTGRRRADRGPGGLVRIRRHRAARRLLTGLPAPGLAGSALLLVDDHAAAHVRPLRRLRPPAAAVLPGIRVQFGRGRHVPGRELRGPGPGPALALAPSPAGSMAA
jgi:p-hydroxybenzoate 3-monooxygenase